MASYTPYANLRQEIGTETYNVNTTLNDNWTKIDSIFDPTGSPAAGAPKAFLRETAVAPTYTTAAKLINLTPTWNGAAATLYGIFLNVSYSAAEAASRAIAIQRSDNTIFDVDITTQVAVNGISIQGGATAAPAVIKAVGSDANVSISLTPKGTGNVSIASGGLSAVGQTITAATFAGNASSATVLATARNINGVPFDGSADVTFSVAADTLTGNTLAAGVTASSLTSVGTLTGLTTSGNITARTAALSTAIGAIFQNGSTGATATDGLFVGVHSDNNARVWSYDSNNLIFGTNNTARATLDNAGNLGLGVTPSATTGTGNYALQVGAATNLTNQLNGASNYAQLFNNAYVSSSGNYTYINTAASAMFQLGPGTAALYVAPSGTAGNAVTWTAGFSVGLGVAGGNQAVAALSAGAGAYPTSPLSGQLQGYNNYTTFGGGSSHGSNVMYNSYIDSAGTLRQVVASTGGSYSSAGGQFYIFTWSASGAAGDTVASRTNYRGVIWDGTNDGWKPYNTDNLNYLGTSGNRWAVVYAGNGTIQTSHSDSKNIIETLKPDMAYEVIMGTEFFQYTYKPPKLKKGETLPDDGELWNRKHWGFRAENSKWAAPNLYDTNPLSVACYIGGALQGYARKTDERIARLEATLEDQGRRLTNLEPVG